MMCAPAVDPVTMAAVVKQESAGQPWVVNNNTTKKSTTFGSKAAAVAAAVAAIGRGESVDMGLAQINSKNLPALGLTVEQVFDPCTNIAAGANILAAGYGRTGSLGGALSMYNTGRPDSRIGATYAQNVFGQAGVQVPASKSPGAGTHLVLDPDLDVEVLGREDEFYRLRFAGDATVVELLARYGRIPLPPYIDRAAAGVIGSPLK